MGLVGLAVSEVTSGGSLNPSVALQVLGAAAVHVAGVPVALPSRRTVAVLAYLAVTGEHHSRSHLASLFWPDTEEGTARGNLRVVLSNLKRLVPGVLTVARDRVGLADGAAGQVDAQRFVQAAGRGLARANASLEDARDLLVAALAEYRGPLLAEPDVVVGEQFETWLTTERTRLEVFRRRLLEALIDADLAAGPTEQTVALAEELMSVDEYGEPAMARLMRALAATGRRAAALQRYEAWERQLDAELGVRSSGDLLETVERIREGRSVLTDRGQADLLETRLPPLAHLVGRDHDLDELERLLKDGERLVTVVGSAGIGKTTAAVVVAHRWHVRTRTPVVHVDLTEARDRHALLRSILTRLGDRRPIKVDVDGLCARLRGRTVLLVLDNFEHLLVHRDVVERLHALCPTVGLLVTSQAPLRLRPERVYGLPPLDVPTPTEVGSEASLASSAVRLFVGRAERGGAGFTLTDENLAMVARVCRVLEGLPLAIELASARLPVLGLPGLVAALEAEDSSWHLTVLRRGGENGADHRHRSIRDAVAWTHAQLSDPARELFGCLAVFAGSFDLDAVLGVCADAGGGREQIVDALAELVDFHLVTRVASEPDRVRFRLLVPMRALAEEQLVARAQEGCLRERHARYYLDVATEYDDTTGGIATRRLAQDLDNVITALDWCHEAEDAMLALQVLDRLGRFWRVAGASSHGLELLTRALEAAADPSVGEEYAATAVWRAGLLAEDAGADAAKEVGDVLDRYVPVLEASQRDGGSARCLVEAVHACAVIGDTARAAAISQRLDARPATRPGRWWALTARQQVTTFGELGRDQDQALSRIGEIITEARGLGHRQAELYAWLWVGLMEVDTSRTDTSVLPDNPPTLDDLLVIAAELDDHRYTVWLLTSLGTQAFLSGQLDEAASRYERAMTIARQADYRHGQAFAIMGLVGLTLAADDSAAAARFHGVLRGHLDDLRHVMPSSYLDAYLAVGAHLEGVADTNQAVADEFARGQALPWAEAVTQAHMLLHDRAALT